MKAGFQSHATGDRQRPEVLGCPDSIGVDGLPQECGQSRRREADDHPRPGFREPRLRCSRSGTATPHHPPRPRPSLSQNTHTPVSHQEGTCGEYPPSMPRLQIPTPRRLLLLAIAAALALAPASGCGATTTAPTTGTTVTASPAPPPGAVLVTGALKHPFQVTIDQLRGMPMHTVGVTFDDDKGTEHHTEGGVLLTQLLGPTTLATQNKKDDVLSFAVLAVGADGYRAAVSYGEISPDFANKDVLVAVTEDGKPLSRPRLVVPGDVKGGRYVRDLTELHVSRLTRAKTTTAAAAPTGVDVDNQTSTGWSAH